VFFAQQIKPIPAHAAQNSVHDPGGKLPVGGIKKRAQGCHQQNQAATLPPSRECLGVPSEKGDRPNGGQFQQAAFHPPVHSGSGCVLNWLFQILSLSRDSGLSPAARGKSFLL
jgi:hypothetical protein